MFAKMQIVSINKYCIYLFISARSYVEWSFHEPERDQFNWSGDADIIEFLNIAQQEDLFVLLRPGPYICAERDMVNIYISFFILCKQYRRRNGDDRLLLHSEAIPFQLRSLLRDKHKESFVTLTMISHETFVGLTPRFISPEITGFALGRALALALITTEQERESY